MASLASVPISLTSNSNVSPREAARIGYRCGNVYTANSSGDYFESILNMSGNAKWANAGDLASSSRGGKTWHKM